MLCKRNCIDYFPSLVESKLMQLPYDKINFAGRYGSMYLTYRHGFWYSFKFEKVALLAAKSALKASRDEYIRQGRRFLLADILRKFKAIVPKMNTKGLLMGSKDETYKKLNRQFASFIKDGSTDALFEIVKEYCFPNICAMVIERLQSLFDLDDYEKCLIEHLVVE